MLDSLLTTVYVILQSMMEKTKGQIKPKTGLPRRKFSQKENERI